MNIIQVNTADIKLNGNVRGKTITDESIADLAKNINKIGLLQPIVLQKNGDGYVLIAGHRRLKAFELLKKDTIPATVFDFEDDIAAKAAQLSENEQRLALTMEEQIESVKWFLQKKKSVQQISEMLAIPINAVRSRLQLARLDNRLYKFLGDDDNYDSLFTIAKYSPKLQKEAIKEALSNRDEINLWNVEEYLEDLSGTQITKMNWTEEDVRFGPTCSGCKKRSDCQLGIFQDVFTNDDAICLDTKCLEAKFEKLNEYLAKVIDATELKQVDNVHYVNEIYGQAVTKKKTIEIKDLLIFTEEEAVEELSKWKYYNIRNGYNSFEIQLVKVKAIKAGTVTKEEAETKEEKTVNKIEMSNRSGNAIRKHIHFGIIKKLYDIFIKEHGYHSDTSMKIAQYLFNSGAVSGTLDDYRNYYKEALGRGEMITNQIELPHDERLATLGAGIIDKSFQYWLLTARLDEVLLENNLKLPELLAFDLEIWINNLLKTVEQRETIYRMFTKKELLSVLPTKDQLKFMNKSKDIIVAQAVTIFETFPMYLQLVKNESFRLLVPERYTETLTGVKVHEADTTDDDDPFDEADEDFNDDDITGEEQDYNESDE